MALINCPECGKEISDKASACIHCGYPIQDSTQTVENRIVALFDEYSATYRIDSKIQSTYYAVMDEVNHIRSTIRMQIL